MFAISIETTVGNGRDTIFWSDRWLHGCRLEELAPEVVRCVPLRIRKRRKVNEALHDHAWVADIRSALGWRGLAEYLYLWDLLSGVNLNDTADIHRWKPEASGLFSAKLAYRNFFVGAITYFWAMEENLEMKNAKFFVWLAIRNRCWTTDVYKKRDASSGASPPLRLREETTQHILTSCVFARQFLYAVLQPLSLINLTPTRRDTFATGG